MFSLFYSVQTIEKGIIKLKCVFDWD